MRRTYRSTAVLSALALAAVLTGCGGDEKDKPLTEAEAVALSKKVAPTINLVEADLPGYEATAPEADDDEVPPAALTAAATCFGLSADETADFFGDEVDPSSVDSQDFSKGELPGLEISSSVDVSQDGGVEGKDFKRFYPVVFSDKGADCLGDLFAASAEDSIGDGAKVSVASASTFDVPSTKDQQAGGVRVRLDTTIQGVDVGFDFNFAVIFQDDVAVTLEAFGTGQVVPTATKDTLLSTLSTRLDKADQSS